MAIPVGHGHHRARYALPDQVDQEPGPLVARHERKVLDAVATPVDKYGESGGISAPLLGGAQFHTRGDEAERITCLAPMVESPDRIGGHRADQLTLVCRPGRALLPCALDAEMGGGGSLQPADLVADRLTLGE